MYRYNDCRDRGHAWYLPEELNHSKRVDASIGSGTIHAWYTPAVSSGYTVDRASVQRTLVCARCGSLRSELFGRSGLAAKAPRYRYPSDYLLVGASRGRAQYRQVAVKAALKALRPTKKGAR